MTLQRTVSDVVSEHIFEVECIDRMRLNVSVPQLQGSTDATVRGLPQPEQADRDPGLQRYLRRTGGGLLRVDAAAVKAESHLARRVA